GQQAGEWAGRAAAMRRGAAEGPARRPAGGGKTMTAATRNLAALGLTARDGREAAVAGIAVDSRGVRPGFLFAALPGTAAHGVQYVPQALAAGAGAILTDRAGEGQAAGAIAASGGQAALVV